MMSREERLSGGQSRNFVSILVSGADAPGELVQVDKTQSICSAP